MKTIDRKTAKINGLSKYFTGKECKNGHIAVRRTVDGVCMTCANERQKVKYHDNPKAAKDRKQRWDELNPNYHKEHSIQYYHSNKREKLKYSKKWRQENRSAVRSHVANRRAAKQNATVIWAEQDQIKQLYDDCVMLQEVTGIEFQVDHIVPLVHKLVCGLHCIDNLQIITKSENQSKKNRFSL